MADFIKLNSKDRTLLIQKAKVNYSKNYYEFAKRLNVTRDMIFKYARGDYLIPKKIFLELIRLSKFKPKSYRAIEKEKYNQKIFRIPKMNEDLAEIFGVLNGDGHLSKINHEISVTGNVNTDIEYFNYLKKKFENVLGINFKIEKFEHYIRLRAYSVNLVNWLHEKHGFPKGKKKGNLKIPKSVLRKPALLSSYLRGLFDTDGTIYVRRKHEPVVEISSADKRYLNQIREQLSALGFKVGIGEHRVFLYNKGEIENFFNKIKPSNPKHLNKYKEYSKLCAGGPENLAS